MKFKNKFLIVSFLIVLFLLVPCASASMVQLGSHNVSHASTDDNDITTNPGGNGWAYEDYNTTNQTVNISVDVHKFILSSQTLYIQVFNYTSSVYEDIATNSNNFAAWVNTSIIYKQESPLKVRCNLLDNASGVVSVSEIQARYKVLPTIPTNKTDLGNNLIDHAPSIAWDKGTDAGGETVVTYIYTGTGATPSTFEGSTTSETFDLGTNTTFTDGSTYYYRLRSYDGHFYSNYTTADEFRMNSIPSISNVTISPVPTVDTDDLTAHNDTAADSENDAITLYYRWYKNSTLQPALNDEVTILASNLTTNDIWKVGIIPNDGYENGTEVQSSTTTIGLSNVAPTLTGIQSNLTTRKYNQSVIISTLNATDDNDDNYILYIGTATGLSDLCTSASTPNGTQANCSFDVPWTSGSHTIYGRLYDGNDTSIEYQEVITVDVTPPVIGATSVSSSSGLADFPFSITADVIVANGSVSWVYACVSKLGDTCINYSMSHAGGSSYTGSYTDTTAAGNYYVTYYSSDDSGNIAYKSTPDSVTLAPSQGQGGGGGVTINETIIEIGDLTLTPPRLDTYFFLTSFDEPQTAEYTFIANRKVESCSIEPNDLTSCEIVDGYIIKARMIVNSSTESYIGKLTVVDESGYTASADIIVRVVDLGSAIPIANIPVGGLLADMLSLFFVTVDDALVGIRIWTLTGLFGGLIVAVWYSM